MIATMKSFRFYFHEFFYFFIFHSWKTFFIYLKREARNYQFYCFVMLNLYFVYFANSTISSSQKWYKNFAKSWLSELISWKLWHSISWGLTSPAFVCSQKIFKQQLYLNNLLHELFVLRCLVIFSIYKLLTGDESYLCAAHFSTDIQCPTALCVVCNEPEINEKNNVTMKFCDDTPMVNMLIN